MMNSQHQPCQIWVWCTNIHVISGATPHAVTSLRLLSLPPFLRCLSLLIPTARAGPASPGHTLSCLSLSSLSRLCCLSPGSHRGADVGMVWNRAAGARHAMLRCRKGSAVARGCKIAREAEPSIVACASTATAAACTQSDAQTATVPKACR